MTSDFGVAGLVRNPPLRQLTFHGANLCRGSCDNRQPNKEKGRELERSLFSSIRRLLGLCGLGHRTLETVLQVFQ